jgi:hypothetical protein
MRNERRHQHESGPIPAEFALKLHKETLQILSEGRLAQPIALGCPEFQVPPTRSNRCHGI